MKALSTIAVLSAFVFTPAPDVYGHSGGLNAQGCHAGSRPYHCHRAQTRSRSTSSSQRNPIGGDRDCSDFSSWRQAQDFFRNAGPGDPHRLDGDNDGVACESLR